MMQNIDMLIVFGMNLNRSKEEGYRKEETHS